MIRHLLKAKIKQLKPSIRFAASSGCVPMRRDKLEEPPVVVSFLKNGLAIASEQTGVPLACISLFIETGPKYEAECNNGINHFIEHLAFTGYNNTSKYDIQYFADTMGARFSAHTSQEMQRFTVVCNPDVIQQATCVLCGIVDGLTMDDCEVEIAKNNILFEMEDADRDYKALVFENLIQSAFQGTSLGRKVVGPTKNLSTFTGGFAKEYMRGQYHPCRILFAASGSMPNSCMSGIVKEQLACLSAPPEPTCPTSRFTGSSVIYRDDSRDFAYIAVAFEAPGYLSDDYLAMILLKNIIGSWSKTQSIFGVWPDLARRCADSDLCHHYESFYLAFEDIALWGVYFLCASDAEDFLYNWQTILLGLGCCLSDNDVARAKSTTKLELIRDRTGSINSSLSLGREMIYRGKRPSLDEYFRALDNLSTKEIQELAHKTFYNRQPVLSAAGRTESVPDYNRLAAYQYWIRW